MTERFANDASTSLTEAVNASVTKVKVASATGFPPSAQFRIRIDAEIMLVTAGAGTTEWTVERAVEAVAGVQTAAAHGGGAKVKHVLTAGALGAFGTTGSVTAEQARAEGAEALKLAKASNLSDVASASTARTNLGLGSAATQSSSAFDTAGAAASEETRAKAAEATKADLVGGKLKESELPVSVVSDSEGEGAPAKGLALNRYYRQKEGSKTIALWRGNGAGEEPEQVADLSGTPAATSITSTSQFAAALVDGAVASPTLRSLLTKVEADNAHAATAEAVQKALEAQRPLDYVAQVVAPIAGRSLLPTAVGGLIGVANKAVFMRAIVPKSGTLHDLAVANGEVVNGNHRVAVFDTGQATPGEYTPLWESGSVAAAGEKAWQVVADPVLAVTAGQEILLAVMNSGTTHKFGTIPNAGVGPLTQLPTNFMPLASGNAPKLVAARAYSEFKFAAVTEANMVTFGTSLALIARVA